MQDRELSQDAMERELELLKWEEIVHAARNSLIGFTIATKPNYEVNWHHRAFADILERVLSGELKRVIVTMPPQNGKSELMSRRFPAYAFGKRPEVNIIAGTYGQELASKNNTDIQNTMDTELYRTIFPEAMIPGHNAEDYEGTYKRNQREFSIVGTGGGYRCAGVGGPISGFPADILLLDDLIKNREEGDSFVIREKVWNWFTSVVRPRINKTGAIVLTMTRWHQDDPIGRIEEMIKTVPDFDQFVVFNFPAVADPETINEYDKREAGQALWPSRYDIPYLNATRATSGSRDWNAIYQGSPVNAEGAIFKRSWFKFYRELPGTVNDWLQSWDLSFEDKESSSRTCGGTFCRNKHDIYMTDIVKGLLNYPAQKQAITTFSAKPSNKKAFTKLIEKKANGAALIAEMGTEIGGLVPVEPRGSKIDRAKAASPTVEAGNFYLPHPDIAPWVHDFIDEMCNFPTGRYNDQVDMFSQAILRYRTGGVGQMTQDFVPKKTTTFAASINRGVRRW